MSGQETGGQELRERITLAIMGRTAPRAAAAVLAELGYGTHRCVRCGQPQAQEDDTCPPCDGEIYREEILELRTDHEGRLRQAEAERDQLREAVERVREIAEAAKRNAAENSEPGDQLNPYISVASILAALDQSDTSTPQQAADDTHAAGTGRNQTP